MKYIMKERPEIKVNCSELARRLNCDRRTVSRYVKLGRSGEKPSQRVYQKKTDGFEHIIEEKIKTTAPAIAMRSVLKFYKCFLLMRVWNKQGQWDFLIQAGTRISLMTYNSICKQIVGNLKFAG